MGWSREEGEGRGWGEEVRSGAKRSKEGREGEREGLREGKDGERRSGYD